MIEPTELDIAAHLYQEAKAAEDEARNARLAAEERLVELVGLKEEGTITHKTAWYKVSTIGKLTRTLIQGGLQSLREAIGDGLFDTIVQYEPKLSLKGLRACESANPEAYHLVARAIVTKPAKAAVKVELIEQAKGAA